MGRIGIIGGSGFYALPDLKVKEEIALETPWGMPSRPLVVADFAGREVVFLARHGKGHRLLPHEVNYRANIAALAHVGCREVFAFSAVGSLREELAPLDFVLPDQVIDRSRARASTFFGEGVAGHVAFADPYCGRLADVAAAAGAELGIAMHRGETLVCIEGPTFSTRAESRLYRSWGAGVINMSAQPEARLAREAELCYCLICMVTDYDCWRSESEDVDVGVILDNLGKNTRAAAQLLRGIAERAAGERTCACGAAARKAIITAAAERDRRQEERLRYVLGDVLGGETKGA